MGRLEGKVALVTGGASGIGRGVVEKYVAEGARVVVADINASGLAEVAGALGDAVTTVEADIMDEAQVENMVATAVDRFGRLDIAVNCAFGIQPPPAGDGNGDRPPARRPRASFGDQPVEQWKRTVDVALTGTFICIKHEARRMVEQGDGGAIINIVSINSRQPGEGMSAYCSAKAGLEMLIRCAAMELGPAKVRVTGIGPGLIRTPLTAGSFANQPILDAYLQNIPMGRPGEPEDIANAAAYLGSDEASWVSGDTLFVDGGSLTREYPRMFEVTAALEPQPSP